MNRSNFMTVIATLLIATIFFISVLLNIKIKNLKDEISTLDDEIRELRLSIKRERIEISALESPHKVLDYIEKAELKTTSLDKIETLTIK